MTHTSCKTLRTTTFCPGLTAVRLLTENSYSRIGCVSLASCSLPSEATVSSQVTSQSALPANTASIDVLKLLSRRERWLLSAGNVEAKSGPKPADGPSGASAELGRGRRPATRPLAERLKKAQKKNRPFTFRVFRTPVKLPAPAS